VIRHLLSDPDSSIPSRDPPLYTVIPLASSTPRLKEDLLHIFLRRRLESVLKVGVCGDRAVKR
jgi:hypothetical protein